MSERSRLLNLLQSQSTAKQVLSLPDTDLGLAELEPFPFLGIVGQDEMKLALLLAVINPLVGGVLLIGSRGTAKTTAARSLIDLLPPRRRSLCAHGCTEVRLEEQGLDGICQDCAEKVGYGQALTVEDRVRLVELPLNAQLDDVVGGINERIALEQQRVRLERGILATADGNILYIDEVNLLDHQVTDAILDAAAQGFYIVRRGPLNLRYRSRFLLIGSMNPEEGQLRPQIMDRFGLRAVVRGLTDPNQRFQVYEQSSFYRNYPERLAAVYAEQTLALAEEVKQARERLPQVTVQEEAVELGLSLIQKLQIDSSRAEISLFEAARAHAAADERLEATPVDIQAVALLSLRQRQSKGLVEFFETQQAEDAQVRDLLEKGVPEKEPAVKKNRRRK
jgi:magnesium chelatase subunit I